MYRLSLRLLALALAILGQGLASSAQLTAHAGADRIVVFPDQLTLAGSVSGGRDLDFWTADGNGAEENKLVKFNSTTGVTTAGPIQTTGGIVYGFVNDLIRIDNVVYGVAPILQTIFSLDEFTGIATPIGGAMGAPSIRGLAYDEGNDILYGVDYSTNHVVSIDRVTSVATNVVSNIQRQKTRCLAFDETSGLLYAWGEASDWLFTVDLNTGATNNVMLLTHTIDEVFDDLQFHDGELYIIRWNYSSFDTQLLRIDLGNQTMATVGDVLPDVTAHCLLVNSIPEPVMWTKVKGLGMVTFGDPESLTSSVSFSAPGVYELRLVVSGENGPVGDIIRVQVVTAGGSGNEPNVPPVATPQVSFAIASQNASEGANTISVSVQLNTPQTDNVTVPLILGGSATAGADYSASPNPIVITAGLVSASVTLTITDDALFEGDETIAITLGQPTNASLGGIVQHIVTINDNDASPDVSFALGAQNVAESVGFTPIAVQLSAISGLDVTIPYSVSGSASQGDDYSLPPSPVVIPAGMLSASLLMSVVDDSLDEINETIQIDLGSPTGADLGSTTQHITTLLDNDGPTVAFAAPTQVLGEAGVSTTVTVQLSAISPQDVSVPFARAGTAISPADYTASATPLLIPAGQASADITIQLVDDNLDEDDETIALTLGAPTGGQLGALIQHVATITDNDLEPTVNFTSPAQSVSESIGTATITAQLSSVSGRNISLPFIFGGTATNLADYAISASPLVILAGQLSADITISIVDDNIVEPDEQVGVTLTAPTNALLGTTTQHTLTILDNDGGKARTSLTVIPDVAHLWIGGTLRLTLSDEDLRSGADTTAATPIQWTLDAPLAGTFLESDHAFATGNVVHFVAGEAPGLVHITATDPATGLTGVCELTLAPLVFDFGPFADVPGDGDLVLDGTALAFQESRALLALNPHGRRATLLLTGPASSTNLRVAGPLPPVDPSAIRAVAFDGRTRAWAMVEGPGANYLAAFDTRLAQLDLLSVPPTPLPLLNFEAHARLGKRLITANQNGELAALGPWGEPLGTLRFPAQLEPASLISLGATPDGAWLVTDGTRIHRIETTGEIGSFSAPPFDGAITDLAVSPKGHVFVLIPSNESPLHVLDIRGREIVRLGGPDSALQLTRPLAIAADERSRLLIFDDVAPEPGVIARLLLATPRPDGNPGATIQIEPRETWLRPGLAQLFIAHVDSEGELTWHTESGVFLDTGLEFSHANPVQLVAGPLAGEFELSVELDAPGTPTSKVRVIVNEMPATDHVLLQATTNDD